LKLAFVGAEVQWCCPTVGQQRLDAFGTLHLSV
jgi:hypothetical protein